MKTVAILIMMMVISAVGYAEEIDQEKLVMAIYKAEGHAKKPFGILSVRCDGYEACKRVCSNTVRNNVARWKKAGSNEDFISFLQRRYAPTECHPLNANWQRNVRYFYERG